MNKLVTTLFLLLLIGAELSAQDMIFYGDGMDDVIKIDNPSFIGAPMVAKAPKGWANCAVRGNSASDILPGYRTNFFGVTLLPYDGNSYVGMVMRADSTWESLAQQLSEPFEKDSLYSFSIFAAQSEVYTSISRSTNLDIEHITPGVLRIWGGNSGCHQAQLLGQTETINHFDWMKYVFEFKAEDEWDYITLEAYYDDRRNFPYAGNVLIDNCSNIKKIGKLRTVLKPENLNLKTVKRLVRNCQSNELTLSYTGDLLINTVFLGHVFNYQDLQKGQGIQQFILSNSISDLAVTIRCLEKLGAKHSVQLIRELTRISQKNKNNETTTEEEKTFFDNAILYHEEKMLEDNLDELIKRYISANKLALTNELEECY